MSKMTHEGYKAAIRQANARVAAASRKQHYGKPTEIPVERLEAARAEMVALRLEAAIHEALHPAEPYRPIRDGDKIRLAEMLLGDYDGGLL